MSCISSSPPETLLYDIETLSLSLQDFGAIGEYLQGIIDSPNEAVRARSSLLLYGNVGIGKSTLAAAFHSAWAARGRLAAWVDCEKIPGNPMEAAEELFDLEQKSLYYVAVFDDLGKEAEHNHKRVANVISTRHLMKYRFDIYTTNLNIDPENIDNCEFAEVYSERIRSRVWQACQKNIIEVNGQDFRVRV